MSYMTKQQTAVLHVQSAGRQEVKAGDLILEAQVGSPQHVTGGLGLELGPYAREDDKALNRLVDVVDSPEFEAVPLTVLVIESGNENDRYLCGRHILLHPAQHLEAIHVRHQDIEQHQIWHGRGRERRQCLGRRGTRSHAVIRIEDIA